MNTIITNSPNFQAIQLSAADAIKAESYINKLCDNKLLFKDKKVLKNKIFDIFEPYIKEEAMHKAAFNIFEEVFAEMSLNFSELLYTIKNYPTLNSFIEKLNEYKPSKNTLKSQYIYKSIDTPVFEPNSILKKIDLITSEHLPNPNSSEYLRLIKTRINKAIDRANISPVIKKRIIARLKGIKFKDIAKKDKINIRVAKCSVKKGVMKIQHDNGILSQKYIEKAQAFADVLNCDTKKAIEILLKNPAAMGEKPETMMQNIKNIAKLLDCSEEKIIKFSLKYPSLCLQRPKTLMNNVHQSAKILDCTEGAFIKAGLNLPPLFCFAPETLLKKAQKAAELFDCPKSAFIKAALKQTQLFCQKPETLKNNIEKTALNLKCSESNQG